MTVEIVKKNIDKLKPVRQKSNSLTGHSRALPITIDIKQPGWLRIGHLMTIFGVSHSALYKGLGTKYPQADGKDGKRPYWNTKTILNALEGVKI